MNDEQTSGVVVAGPGAAPNAAGGAQKLAAQKVVNRIVRGLLRMPLLCRVVGKRLLTMYVVGRKSGRQYVLPVAYAQRDGILLVGTPFGWVRNLRTGEPVDIRLKGKRRAAGVEVITDEPGVVAAYGIIARDNHNFAKFNKIGFDGDGNPDPTDLHRAWSAGARAVRLTVH